MSMTDRARVERYHMFIWIFAVIGITTAACAFAAVLYLNTKTYVENGCTQEMAPGRTGKIWVCPPDTNT